METKTVTLVKDIIHNGVIYLEGEREIPRAAVYNATKNGCIKADVKESPKPEVKAEESTFTEPVVEDEKPKTKAPKVSKKTGK